jgi:hypothetical protein
MVSCVIVSCSKRCCGVVLQDDRCRAGGRPRNCLQAAADVSQPYKGVSESLLSPGCRSAGSLDGLTFQPTAGLPFQLCLHPHVGKPSSVEAYSMMYTTLRKVEAHLCNNASPESRLREGHR